MGKSGEPEGEATTATNTNNQTTTLPRPKDPKMQAARVHMPNGSSKDFELLRGSDGEVLFAQVTSDLSIEEREYFALCFYDEVGLRHWLYNDKKILRQLKGLPWDFSFEVKFYPTAPLTLNDDNARYNLFLQLKKDIGTGRLPATIPTHVQLAACVAQAEFGDADASAEYEKYLREANFVKSVKENPQNIENLKELHKELKGLTAAEAEARYLETCKQLSMYGVFCFDATDSQNQPVIIGICASGINIYKDTIRMHRFSWQNIVKISYRKNHFSIKLKPGELDAKKQVTLSYKVRDYLYAKRVWKCGVEHHTFFRLIQPEDKPKSGYFRWGSTRFRYQGRTQFQTKMASQMFDHPTGTVQKNTTPGRLTQSCDNVNKENIPVHDKSATLGREGNVQSPEPISPGISYEIASAKRAGSSNGKVGSPLLDSDDELVYTPVETPTSAAYYLSERSSLRSPYSSGAVSPNEWSASSGLREVSYRHISARRNLFGRAAVEEGDSSASERVRLVSFHAPADAAAVSSTARAAELEVIPIQQAVQLYHRGFYNEQPREPTVRIVHYAPRNGVPAVDRLEPINELDAHPIRFFVNMHHSGESDRVRISRIRYGGVEDVVDPNPANYVFQSNQGASPITAQISRSNELVPASIIEHSAVYYYGKGSGLDPEVEKPKYRLIAKVLPREGASTSSSADRPQANDARRPLQQVQIVNGQHQREERPGPSRREQVDEREVVQDSSTVKNITTTSKAGYPATERYEGPLDSVDRRDDMANLPLDQHPRLLPVSKTTTRVFETTHHVKNEVEPEEPRRFRYIAWLRHEGEEDVVEKDKVEHYNLPSTSYDGPLEDISRQGDLEHQPLGEHAQVYHSGQSWPKTKHVEHKVEPKTEHKEKTAVLHLKSPAKPVEEEKSEVRLVARILPSEPEDSTGKTRESTKFGFFKSSGKKTKPEKDTRAVAGTSYPVTEKYEGPLDSVDRRDDLENLPLDQHPRLLPVSKTTTRVFETTHHVKNEVEPEEPRRFRYIAWLRHEGEEDVVEKDKVEHYNLPSTSYDGPLEDISRQGDLEHQPLGEHAQVYHSGQSWPKTKHVEHKVEPKTEHKEKTAVLHLKSPAKPVEEEKSEVRLVARILPSEPEDSTGKTRESTKFGFFKSSGKKTKPEKDTRAVAGTSYPVTEKYEGPLDSVDRRDDLENLPLDQHPRLLPVSKTTTRVFETTHHVKNEVEPEEPRRFRYIAWLRHEGEEDVVEKDKVEHYNLPSTSYDGPLEDISRQGDLEHQPLGEHAQVYHSGQSWPKTKHVEHKVEPKTEHKEKTAVLHLKSPAKPVEEEKSEVRLVARILPSEPEDSTGKTRESTKFGFFKSSGKKTKPEKDTRAVAGTSYPVTEKYEGPLDSVDRRDDLENLPLDQHPRLLPVSKTTTRVFETTHHVKNEVEPEEPRRFRYIAWLRHEGEEDVVEKDKVEHYNLPSTSYDGPLEDISRQGDLEHQPLGEHAQVYHSGQSWPKTKHVEHKVEPKTEHKEKTAVLHLKSPAKPVEEEKSEVRLVARILPSEPEDSTGKTRESTKFGFFKSSGKKTKPEKDTRAVAGTSYPVTEKYEGPLDSVDRRDDLENLPLDQHPRLLPVSKTTTRVFETTHHVKNEVEPEEPRRFRYIAWLRHEGEEDVVEKDKVEHYNLPSTSYDGPLEDISRQGDLEHQPLGEHAQVYHSGQSWPKTKHVEHKVEPKTEHKEKTAVLHLKSPAKPVEEEKSEVRLVARILPSEPEDSTGKTRESTKFGFFKSSGKKTKPEKDTRAVAGTSYPVTEKYEGPLDSVDRRDDLENLPLDQHPRLLPVSKTTTRVFETTHHVKNEVEPEEPRRFRYIAWLRHEGEEDVVEKDKVEHYNLPSTSYDGPLEDISRQGDLEHQPLGEHAQVYHSGQSWPKTKHVEHKVEPKTEHKEKTAVLHLKSPAKPVEEEKSEVRLVARILPSEPEDSTGKTRESTKFGFFKSSGKKTKPEKDTRAVAGTSYPVTEKYEGPLDSVDRRDDLENLPLDQHPRLLPVSKTTTRVFETTHHVKNEVEPEEPRRFRYIAWLRHEGEEDVVEKDKVEHYNLPSTSYDGPLEDISRQGDLEHQPLGEHAQVYHSGQSWPKTKHVEHKVEPKTEHKEKTAVLHLKSPAKPVEEEKSEVRLVARILPSEPEDSTGKTRESTKFGFFKSSGKKTKPEKDTRAVAGTSYPVTEKYEGPLDSVDRRDDLENLPLDQHPRLLPVSKTTTRVFETTHHVKNEVEPEEPRRFRYIAWLRHEGEEDVVEKDKVEHYNLPSTSYDGPLEDISRQGDLEHQPLGEHAQVYHSGQSWPKTKHVEHKVEPKTEHKEKTAVLHLKSPAKPVEEEKSEVRLVARILPSEPEDSTGKTRESTKFGFFKSSGKKTKPEKDTHAVAGTSYPVTEKYEGPLDSVDRRDDLENLPLDQHPRLLPVSKTTTRVFETTHHVKNEVEPEEPRRFRYIAWLRHEGEEDVVEKDKVEHYNLPSTSYDGPLEDISRQGDLEHQPLGEHAQVYHSGQSWPKTKHVEHKVEPKTEHKEKTAVLHLKSPAKPVEEEKSEVRLVARILPSEPEDSTGKTRESTKFGFFKSSGKKTKPEKDTRAVAGTSYPVTEKYEGPLDLVDRRDDLENLPLDQHPRLPSVSKTITRVFETTHHVKSEVEPEEPRRFRYIAWLRHEGEEDVVEKDKVEHYNLPSTSYDGPLEDISRQGDLEHQPLGEHAQVYHSGQSWPKTKHVEHKVEPKTEQKEKTAVLHLKSPAKPVEEEKSEVRLVARILPSEPEDSTGKTRESTKFGFFKSSGKKTKPEKDTRAVAGTSYPVTEKYEGPLDSVDHRDDLENLPLDQHPRLPSVSKTTTRVFETTHHVKSEVEPEEPRRFRYIAWLRHEGEEDVVEKDKVEHYNLPSTSYDGPLEDISRQGDLEHQPLGEHAQVYHSGQSWPKTKHVEHKVEPKTEHKEKTAVLHLKSPAKPVEEEKSEVRLVARILPSEPEDSTGKTRESTKFGFFKSSGKKTKPKKDTHAVAGTSYPVTEKYEGPLDSVDRRDDLENLPLDQHPRLPSVSKTTTRVFETTHHVKNEVEPEEPRRFRYIAWLRHEGEEDVVEKDKVEHYNLPSTSYDGPLEDISRQGDLEHQPLGEHAQVYHSGQSWPKTKHVEHKVEPKTEHKEKTAVLHLKSPAKPVEEEKSEVRLVARILPSEPEDSTGKTRESTKFGFFKSSGKKTKPEKDTRAVAGTSYPVTEKYEGPLDSVDRRDDLENLPLDQHPRLPSVSKTTTRVFETTHHVKSEVEPEEPRRFRYIAWLRHEGEEDVVEKDKVEHYNLPSTSYDGPLEDISRQGDLEHQPLGEHAQVYHSGQSWPKTKHVEHKVEPKTEHKEKTAVLHLKSPAKPVEEEKSEVRLVARILPSEPEDSTGKTRESTKFGFFKSSGKKTKPEKDTHAVAGTSYPVTEKYEGPLDSVDRRDDLENLPLDQHPRLPSVSKTTTRVFETTHHVKSEVEPEEPRRFRYIAWLRHEGEEDVVEKDKVEHYNLPSTSYDGPLEDISRQGDLEHQPLGEHAQVYHSGQSWPKTKHVEHKVEPKTEHKEKTAVLHLKSPAKPVEEEKSEVRLVARILPSEPEDSTGKTRESTKFGFFKSSGKKTKPEKDTHAVAGTSYPVTEKYEGPLDSVDRRDDLENLPLDQHPRLPSVSKTTTRVFETTHHVKNRDDKVEHYSLPSTSYEGPLEDISRQDDLEYQPLSELSWQKTRDIDYSNSKPKSETRLVARVLPSERDDGRIRDSEPAKTSPSKDLAHEEFEGRHFSSSHSYHSEGTTIDGQQWIEVRVERRVEVQLEPVFYLTGAGLGAVSEDEGGLIFSATPPPMAPAGRSFLSRLGFKSKKSKKAKGEHEADSSESSSSDDEHRVKVVPVVETTTPTVVEPTASGKLVRHETKEQSYRLSGLGRSSGFNPEHPSLSSTIAEAERLNQRSPRLEHAERTITVRALAPLPVSFEESGQPHTTVATWQERTVLPDDVTVEYDEHGNRITRTVKTSQVKHTVQKQTFQNYVVPDEGDPSSTLERSREQMTPLGLPSHTGPVVDTHSRSVVYDASSPAQGDEGLGEFVSSKTVTSGNRTIETITYKTERDGIIETHVEHRVTIHSDVAIDHDAELSAAIAEATQMNPDMTVEKIEVRQETST